MTEGGEPVSTHSGWIAHEAVAVVCSQAALLVPVGNEVVVKSWERQGRGSGGLVRPCARDPENKTPEISDSSRSKTAGGRGARNAFCM